MAPEVSKIVRRITFVLVALATIATEIAADEQRPLLRSIGIGSIGIAIAFVLNWLVPFPEDPKRKPPLWLTVLVLLAAGAPFLIEPFRRDWFNDGNPLELQMVYGLRNVALALVVFSGWLLCLRIAAITSLFLILFATASTNDTAMMVLLGLYTTCGALWLMLTYWTGLRSVFVPPEKEVNLEVQTQSNRWSWVGLGVLGLLLGLSLAVIVVGPQKTVYVLGEWLPTSGGTGDTDPFARSGIGDGPEEAAGDNAQAAGMVDTEKLIEDNRNALIDAVGDTYGPPHKPNKDQERMVAAGLADVIQFHGKLPENRRPSRDFDTGRKGPQAKKSPSESQNARGVFEVQGRTPIHVRLVVYEKYDVSKNRWLEGRRPTNRLLEEEGNDWMRLGHLREADWYSSVERHQLKVADLKSNIVPTPTTLTRFKIRRVDRADYYEWDFEGVLAIAGRGRTPSGVIVYTDSVTFDWQNLPESSLMTISPSKNPAHQLNHIPEEIRPQIEQIAQQWAGHLPQGPRQIEAIINQLRNGYEHNREISSPEDHPHPVLWFLNESRTGPDYLFASSATFLLRALGYQTRLCLGYYASPDSYDRKTGHTPVKANDLHFWTEVKSRDGHWLVVETTPGYEMLTPEIPLREKILNTLSQAGKWILEHSLAVIVLVLITMGIGFWRREIWDFILSQWWSWFPSRTWEKQVFRTLNLLEKRGRWTGHARPNQTTPPRWMRQLTPPPSESDSQDWNQLARMAEWACYAPQMASPWSIDEVHAVCRSVLSCCSLRYWRKIPPLSATGEWK